MTSRQKCHLGVSLSILICGCNGVFGLDEGELGPGGASSMNTASASGGTNTGGANTGAATSASGGMGGDCTLDEGLLNPDFSEQDSLGPKHWLRFADATALTLATLPSQTTGLSMTFTDISNGQANGGVYQSVSFLDPSWDQCVVVSGSARRTGNAGRLRARASFNDQELVVSLPSEESFTSFRGTCRIAAPFETFLVRLEADQLPTGGTANFQLESVALDHACCTGGEPMCETP